MPRKLRGICGDEINTCKRGELNDTPDSRTRYRWKCEGVNGGLHKYCYKRHSTHGMRCGLKENKCFKAKLQDTPDTDKQFKWNCVDRINASNILSCSKDKPKPEVLPINGMCGTRDDGLQNGCENGTYKSRHNENRSGTWYSRWFCLGKHGGTDVSCERQKARHELTTQELGYDIVAFNDRYDLYDSPDDTPVCVNPPVFCNPGRLRNSAPIKYDAVNNVWTYTCETLGGNDPITCSKPGRNLF